MRREGNDHGFWSPWHKWVGEKLFRVGTEPHDFRRQLGDQLGAFLLVHANIPFSLLKSYQQQQGALAISAILLIPPIRVLIFLYLGH